MARYRRRRPETTVLYRVVHGHLDALIAQADARYEFEYPAHIEKTYRAYLDCGLLRNGFARVVCEACGNCSCLTACLPNRPRAPRRGCRFPARAPPHHAVDDVERLLGSRRVGPRCLRTAPTRRRVRRIVASVATSTGRRRTSRAAASGSRRLSEYTDARARRCAGDRDVVFPAGTYQLRVLHGVTCAAAPA